MKTMLKLAAAAGLVSLAACGGGTANDQAADNIEAATENVADHVEGVADNLTDQPAAQALENQAEQVRESGQNAADAVREGTGSGDNVEANTVGM